MSDKKAWAESWIRKEKGNYIGGEWCTSKSTKTFQVFNPANRSPLGDYPLASPDDVDAAASAALHAFRSGVWSKMPREQRAEMLKGIGSLAKEYKEELATLETLPNGKLFRESMEDDLPDCSRIFNYYAGWIDKHYGETCPVEDGFINYTVNEPVGVCGLIVPWNFPLLMACWKLAPALAMGNTVVIKPSEYTPYSLVRFVELIHEKLELPPGVLNLVLGDGETGGAMSSHPNIHKIAFTGSTPVGKEIVRQSANSNLKTVTLELGGKSPNILFEDTPDLEAAIDRSYAVMFSQKGEKCSEPTRIIIHDKIYDRVVSQLAKIAESIRCGDPFAESSQQGPQCHEKHFNKVMHYLELGKKEGARLVAGGERDTTGDNAKGFFVRPTLFADVDNKMQIAQDEIFGPILVATRFETDEEAVAIANDTTYGLAAGLWTADVSRAHRVAGQLDAGMVFVNRYGCYDFSSPFGGFKQSGWGKEMALHSLKAYTKSKSIWVKL